MFLCLIKHYTMQAHWGGGGTASHIHTLGSRCRWPISFMLRRLYSWERYLGTL